MAEQVKIVAEKRSDAGKGVARRLRAEGRIPAVVYGADVESTAIHIDQMDLYHALHTSAGGNVLIRLEIDGDEHLTLARDVQRHAVRGDVLHTDFVALDRDSRIRVEIPVHLEGTEDVAAPGVVQHVLHTVPVLVRPLDIPDYFTLEVGDMVIGDTLRVDDIDLPEGAEFDIESDRTIITVSAPTILEEPEEEPEIPEELAELMAELEEEDLTEEEIAERIAEAEAAAEEAVEGEEPEGEEVVEGEEPADEDDEA